MIGKYDASTIRAFTVLDSPQPCARCGRTTLALFDGAICSRCAGVWSPAERAATLAAIRRPFPENPKPRHAPPQKLDRAAEVAMLIEALSPKNSLPRPSEPTVLGE
jgi:hypothetical protein